MNKLFQASILLLTAAISANAQTTGITISPTSLSDAQSGVPYSRQITATGGYPPYTYSVVTGALPPGLTLDPSTGLLSGITTLSGVQPVTYNFTIRATDSSDFSVAVFGSRAYSIVVRAPLDISSPSQLPDGIAGQAYTFQFQATGGGPPYFWFLSQPVPGLSVSSSGLLTANITSPTVLNFSVFVSDTFESSVSRSFSLRFVAPTSPLVITTNSLPNGQVNVPYSAQISASGGTPPYTFSLVSATGVFAPTLSPSGLLTGTPTSAGAVSVTVSVRDSTVSTSSLTASRTFNFSILPPTLAITSSSPLPNGKVATPYSFAFSGTGGTPPYSWSLASGTLPAGLTLSPNGSLTGTPTSVGTSSFVVRLQDTPLLSAAASPGVTADFTLTIASGLTITPDVLGGATQGQPYAANISAVNGVPPYTLSLISGSLPSGLTFSNGAISGTPTTVGTSSFVVRATDSQGQVTKSYSIGVRESTNPPLAITTRALPPGSVGADYSFTLAATGGTPPYSWSGQDFAPGLSLSTAGVLSGKPTKTGSFPIVIRVADSLNNGDGTLLTLVVNGPAITITPATLPAGQVGVAYPNTTIGATGGTAPYTLSLLSGSLPAGLTFTPATGAVTGTPTTVGSSTFTVQAADSTGNTGQQQYTLTVGAAPPTITNTSLASGPLNVAYSQTLTATGGTQPYTFSISGGSLPAGLTLNSTTGAITGTPTTAGTSSFTAQVTDSQNKTGTKQLSIVIGAALSITTASPLPVSAIGTASQITLAATGGAPPYTFSLVTGNLPDGLTLGANGAITGTPTTAGSFSFTAQVKDSANQTATKAFTAQVVAAVRITTTSPLASAVIGSAYSQSFAATGGTAPYTWVITGLPAGLQANAAGAITGTSTAIGSSSLNVTVTDANNLTATGAFTLATTFPPVSAVNITAPDTSTPAQQPRVSLNLGSSFPVDVTGNLVLTFTPDAVVSADDPAIQFSSGGRTASFRITSGQTAAIFTDPNLAVQTGTVAGTITMTATLQANGTPVTCSCTLVKTIRIARSAPVITSVTATKNVGGFTITIIGYSSSRELTNASFHFNAGSAGNLRTTDVTVPVGPVFTTWFQSGQSVQFGSQFLLTQPFVVTGDSNAAASVAVTLTNSVGSSTAVTANIQ